MYLKTTVTFTHILHAVFSNLNHHVNDQKQKWKNNKLMKQLYSSNYKLKSYHVKKMSCYFLMGRWSKSWRRGKEASRLTYSLSIQMQLKEIEKEITSMKIKNNPCPGLRLREKSSIKQKSQEDFHCEPFFFFPFLILLILDLMQPRMTLNILYSQGWSYIPKSGISDGHHTPSYCEPFNTKVSRESSAKAPSNAFFHIVPSRERPHAHSHKRT